MNRIAVIFIDLFLIHFGYVLSFFIRYGGKIPGENFPAYLFVAPWLSVVAFACFQFYGLYSVTKQRWIEVFYSLACTVGLILIGVVFISFIGRQFAFPRTVLAISFFVHLVLLSMWRYLHWKLVRKRFGVAKVIVVGNYCEAVKVAQKLVRSLDELVSVQGIICGSLPKGVGDGFPVLGVLGEGITLINQEQPDVVYLTSGLDLEFKKEIICNCLSQGIDISLVPDLYDIFMVNAKMGQIDDIPVFRLRKHSISENLVLGKRVLDICVSLLVLILTAPLLVLVVLLIKVDSPGPVFFRQERLSKKGHIFELYKFRTMICDAEKDSGPVLAVENDPRITRIGWFLRKTRIDELPQFINVLKGEMSVIGPRPERPFFVEQFSRKIPEYMYRMEMKAGITGLAQVAGKYSTAPEDKLRFDLLYSRTHSAYLDFIILLHTVKVMLMRDKAS